MRTKIDAYFAVTLLGLALLACKKGSGDECGLNKDCKDNLVCLSQDIGRGKCRNLAEAKADCQGRSECKASGQCGVSTSAAAEEVAVCAAKSEEDCKQSTGCTQGGKCAFNAKGYCE
jgi:hypothetical protein